MRELQLTNTSVGAISVNGYLPFGTVTRRINCPYNCNSALMPTYSGSDTVIVGTAGSLSVLISTSLVAGAAGTLTASLLVGGANVYSVSQTAAEGDAINLTIPYDLKVTDSNIPLNIQVQVTGVAVTGGTTNSIFRLA